MKFFRRPYIPRPIVIRLLRNMNKTSFRKRFNYNPYPILTIAQLKMYVFHSRN
jgi:hypothetical protein